MAWSAQLDNDKYLQLSRSAISTPGKEGVKENLIFSGGTEWR